MIFSSGTRLGPYEIIDAIGAGGMGEVYRARDPKLNRDVAIKILPALFRRPALSHGPGSPAAAGAGVADGAVQHWVEELKQRVPVKK